MYRLGHLASGSLCIIAPDGNIYLAGESRAVLVTVLDALNHPTLCPLDECFEVALAIAGHDHPEYAADL